MEYLAAGVWQKSVYFPDTLVGTDSHTTMINGLGIVGWGVGGIEAEAAMLGQPVYFLTPDVVGDNFSGSLQQGVTATDLVLRVTEMLRKAKVVGKFVEFHGEGATSLSATDRATIATAECQTALIVKFQDPSMNQRGKRDRRLGCDHTLGLRDDNEHPGLYGRCRSLHRATKTR